jgi:hypothetical protein
MASQIQLQFPDQPSRPDAVTAAVSDLAERGDDEQRGAVFTSEPIVDAILDLVGYTEEQDLAKLRLLEPSFGNGSFIFVALDRLLASFFSSGGTASTASKRLIDAIRAVELHTETYAETRSRVLDRLLDVGISRKDSEALVDAWLIQDDFLLTPLQGSFDFVVGNPPYVRQERIPNPLLAEYRKRFATMYDRADLYIPFYERCLDLLNADGTMGFICANRWLKNKYGGPLREKISTGFRLLYYIDLERSDAFGSEVLAYPSITIISRRTSAATRISLAAEPSDEGMQTAVSALQKTGPVSAEAGILEIDQLASGRDPWLLDSPDVLKIIRRLERDFPSLEQAGCKVGIGVATGCDKVFIQEYDQLNVEESRKLPLAMASDLQDGQVAWSGKGVVNPFTSDGSLAELSDYPLFASFLQEYETQIRGRHVAKKRPKAWYRTIDRIYPALLKEPKLLIPDIKGDTTVAFDPGNYYPHHNLYVITSNHWDLRALQAVLRSSISLLFIGAYCVRMSGGFLRFQAQYLRRIRIPDWQNVPKPLRNELREAAGESDQNRLDAIVLPLFNLSTIEQSEIRKFAHEARSGSSS